MPAVGAFFAGAFGWGATTAVALTPSLAGAWVAGASVANFFTATLAGRLLASVALSALSVALQDHPTSRLGGIRTQHTQTGGTNPASFVIGEHYATDGQLMAPPMSHGEGGGYHNLFLTYVVEVSDLPGQTLEELYLDGELAELGTEAHEDYGLPVQGRFIDRAWVRYYDGSQTAADPMLLDKYPAPLERPWSADMIGEGLCYAVLTFQFDREVWNGFPAVRFVLGGIPMYDPRKDGSVGGTGAHRWDDPATWEQTGNNAVLIYNILRGIDLGGGHIWGGEIAAQDLPLATWFAAMNECDVAITRKSGGTEPQFRAGFEVKVNDDPADVIDELLKGCAGEMAEIGGVFKIRVGPPGLPVFFFDDDDVIVSRPQQLDPFPGLSETWNGVQATYPEPASIWQTKDAPPRFNAGFEADDGGRRLVAELTLPAVPFKRQVQRLMQAYIREERRFRRHELTLPPEANILEPLDAVAYTSARNGYTSKVFEVSKALDGVVRGNPTVSLKERDASDHVWVPDDELPSSTGSILPQVPPDIGVPGFDADPAEISGRRPAIALSWSAGLDAARGIKWEVRVAATSEIVNRGSTLDLAAGGIVLSAGILPGVAYEVRARLMTRLKSVWTGWVPVTAPDRRFIDEDLADTLRDKIDQAFDRHDDTVEEATGAVGDLRDQVIGSFGPLGAQIPLVERMDAVVPEQAGIDERVEQIAQQVGWALTELGKTRQRMADAGIVVDPEAGLVRLTAMEALDARVAELLLELDAAKGEIVAKASVAYVNQAVSTAVLDPSQIPVVSDLQVRVSAVELAASANAGAITLKADTTVVDGLASSLSQAELDIDSLEGAILLKVDQTDFDAAETRLSTAEIELATLDGPSIRQTVIDTRAQTEALDLASIDTFGALWEAFKAREALREGVAFAQTQIYASVDEKLSVEAGQRTAIAAEIDLANAAIFDERQARAAATQALATDLTQLQAQLTSVDGSVQGNALALSSLTTEVSDQGDAITAQGNALTQVQSDLDDAEEDISANSTAISSLDTRVTSTEGTITAQGLALTQVQSDLDDAEDEISGNATALSGLTTTVTDQGGEITALAGRADVIEVSLTGGQVIPNGDFAQGDLRGWSGVPGTWAVIQRGDTTATAVINAPRTYLLSIDDDALNQSAVATTGVPVAPGEAFTVRLWGATRVSGTATATVRFQFLDATGSQVGLILRQQVFTGEAWVQATLETVAAPAGSATVDIRVRRDGGGFGKLYLARVEVQRVAASAADALARVVTIEGAYVDADGARAAVTQSISAEYGSLQALAEATAFAEASADGIAAGYIWRLNGQNLIELVSVADGTGGPVSTYKIAADYVQITGIAQINAAVIESLVATNAFLDNVQIGRGQITNTLESDDYAQDGLGNPTAGLRLNFATGKIKAAGGVITRPLQIAEGDFDPGVIAVNPAAGLYEVQVWDLVATGVLLPVNQVWMASEKTYLAYAAFDGGATAPGGITGNDEYWGCVCEVRPFARWNGPQQLYLRIGLWAKGISALHSSGNASLPGRIHWKLYEVS